MTVARSSEESRIHYCDDLPSDTHICCTSCHEDDEAGYAELFDYTKDGVEWIVCCNKLNLLKGERSTR